MLASIALGVVFSAAALVSFQSRSRIRLFAATSLLTIAICGLHFTAMGAAIITPDPTIIVYPSFMDNTTMALAVAGVTLLVMLAGLAAGLIEKQTVQESVVRLHELADAAAEGIIVAKDGEIINVNQRISELTGWAGARHAGQEGIWRSCSSPVAQARSTVDDRPIETLMITAAGDAIPVEVIWKPYRSGLRANEVYAVRDLQERRLAEKTIRHLAHHDALTGLPNRASLRQRLDEKLVDAQSGGWTFAVLCLDLDRFKEVNDLYGHGA